MNKFWKDSGLDSNRTMEEEYIHCVNSLESEGVNMRNAYDHTEYIRIQKKLHEAKFGNDTEKNEAEIPIVDIFAVCLLGVIIVLYLVKFVFIK